MKMKYFVYCILIGALLSACTMATASPGEIPKNTITPNRALLPPDHFSGSIWRLVDQLKPNESKFSILVHGMKLTGFDTLIICSATKDLVSIFDQPNVVIQLRDDIGQASLLSKSVLYTLGDIDILVMKFQARSRNSKEIYLFIGESESSVYYDGQIAERLGPVEDPGDYNSATHKFGTNQIFEHDNYRISFFGWTPPPTPIAPDPTQTPENIVYIDRATLKIEDYATHQFSFLAIQILSDGQIISELIN